MALITIHQPNYLSWPGFFHKWLISDAFVILDTVQYHKNEWQNRNRIKTVNGVQWLTVPVHFTFPQTIREVSVANAPWGRKQIAAIEQAYARAPFFADYWPHIRPLLAADWSLLRDLNVALIRELGGMIGCRAPLHLASAMGVDSPDPTERLLLLTRALGGDSYLSGREGRNYLQRERFAEAGIGLLFQQVEAPIYPQLHGPFVPYLSLLDLLFNVGDRSESIIRTMGGAEP